VGWDRSFASANPVTSDGFGVVLPRVDPAKVLHDGEVIDQVLVDGVAGAVLVSEGVTAINVLVVDEDRAGSEALVPSALRQERVEVAWGGPTEDRQLWRLDSDVVDLAGPTSLLVELPIVELRQRVHERRIVRWQEHPQLRRHHLQRVEYELCRVQDRAS